MTDIKTILNLWTKLRETGKEILPIHEFGRRNPWDYTVREDFNKAVELDPEGLTALLLLDNFRDDFFSNCGLSISDILSNPNFPSFIQDCRKLTELLSDEQIVHALTGFTDSVSRAVHATGVVREDVDQMLADRYDMAILRRDALLSMQTLSLHQFFQGEIEKDHLTFLPDIHLFWNMNSLIKCAWQSPNGVSINLIKDPLDTSSYFAFVVKNGGNLTVLTDKPKEAHPLSKYMSRRPEKDFTRRIFRNHFPYGLLDLKVSHDGYYYPGNTSIVPLQDKPIKIGSIREMEPDEVIWTIMMFSLLDDKLYKENYHCGQLSYTSDMIADPNISAALMEGSPAGALMVKDYKPLTAPVLNTETIQDTEQYSKYSGSGIHNWLYDRYKDQIPTDILNGILPSDGSTLFMLPDQSLFVAPAERVRRGMHGKPVLKRDPSELTYRTNEHGRTYIWGKDEVEGALPMQRMTGDEFGTREGLLNDYAFFARYNAAKFIDMKAQEEFKARKAEVLSWAKERITANLERIAKDVLSSKLSGNNKDHPCRFSMVEFQNEGWRYLDTYHSYIFFTDRRPADLQNRNVFDHGRKADVGCYFSENAPCSYLLKAEAIWLEDLLYLTGCETPQELPDVLQHWYNGSYSTAEMYTGNHLLARVDPMDWVASNPWTELKFNVVIAIGKKYLNKTKKDLGIQ